MKLIDSPKKRLAWYSRNYFYAATIAVVLTNILLYALLDYYWEGAYGNGHVSWGKSFDFERILRCFLNNFSHSNLLQGCVCAAADGDMGFHGYSGVNYALYAYIIIDYLFSLGTARRNKTDLIFGGVVLALIYFAMCFNGGTSEVSFAVYPYDLLHNLGHGTGFFCGAIVALLIQIPMAAARRSGQAQH